MSHNHRPPTCVELLPSLILLTALIAIFVYLPIEVLTGGLLCAVLLLVFCLGVTIFWLFNLPATDDVPMSPSFPANETPRIDRGTREQQTNHTPTTWRTPIVALQRNGSAEIAAGLARAIREYPTQEMRLRAMSELERFTDQESIDAICAVWAETRRPDLEELIVRKHWRASAPPGTLVLCALQVGDLDDLRSSAAEWIQPLAQACLDPDPLIAERAGQVLQGLKTVEAQEALCRLIIEQEDSPARAAAISTG
ncbi:MAG TPA: hypothetical protein VK880_08480, partial [Anaerolineales bacterium]|nr:hypothetical protein [Anaerolineales bacterium]